MSETCPICGNAVSPEWAACQACGYNLPGSTQRFQAIGAPESEPIRASLNIPSVLRSRLRVVKGPQIGMVYDLPAKEQVVGRNPHCDIFLNDMTVSRQHARIYADGDFFKMEDTNSYNGLWVNNRPVESATLAPGDQIQIGVFCLVFEQD
ncbi:MAG: FHA domain-containing protein [Coriobacteriia bacterium]|nr:FHA domain-containing protein [Coriobacteriia bacterium]